MKKFTLVALFALIAFGASAQKKGESLAAVQLSYGTDLSKVSLGVRYHYNFTDAITLAPSANYYFMESGVTTFDINVDVHYNFNVAERISVYPLAGVALFHWKVKSGDYSVSDSNFAFNVGAGVRYDLSERFALGLEAKYQIVKNNDQFIPTLYFGYRF